MKYDVLVIGGGPAGMIAAGRAGELGAKVVLIEKNSRLGVKLLITGKGRCNITNFTENTRELVNTIGEGSKFLYSALNNFGVTDVISFFNDRGVKTKVERGNRVFPESDRSTGVLTALKGYLQSSEVEVIKGDRVKSAVSSSGHIERVFLSSGKEIVADHYIIATGGKSYPATGSTGDGYDWLENLGHKITKLKPALVPIILKDDFISELEGLSLKNVEISVYKNNKKIDSRFGEALFTKDGMSGPIILDLSKNIGQELPGKITLQIDFKPALSFAQLDVRIQRDFAENSNRMFKNVLGLLLPAKMIPVMIKSSGIDPDIKVNSITKSDRKDLIHLLKEFSLTVKGLEDYDRAIITTGGVDLSEVDSKTMKSVVVDNLYLAGEILDLDGPTGGYNLQICWSTGYLAGESATKSKK
jgi:predicted Rossmann fold flavoprotein